MDNVNMKKNLAKYDFAGRVAVVTGGAKGIGAAIVSQLRDAGAVVAVWDKEKADEAQLGIQVDVTKVDDVDRATATTVRSVGGIDIVVNSAGFAGRDAPLNEYTDLEWRQILEVNLNGSFHVCRSIVPLLKARRWGRIVNVASLAGKEGTPNYSAYSASKAAVLAMTKSLGKELAQTGVLVNAIAPAAIETSLLAQMSPQHLQIMIDKSPMGRLGATDEVAELAKWLCSDSCSFCTGAIFDLSGGRAVY
jgi:NAD(P)-dependent dehydrogenase (short-subunit alcohol dehydrogenase family)